MIAIKKTPNIFMSSVFLFHLYRERDLNPHSHHWPKDFKSFVSTDSTIAAQNRLQRYNKNCIYANSDDFFLNFVAQTTLSDIRKVLKKLLHLWCRKLLVTPVGFKPTTFRTGI